MAKAKSSKSDTKAYMPCLIGIAVSLILALVLTAITTIFITNAYIDIKQSVALAIIIQFISVMIGSYIAIVMSHRRYYMGLIVAGADYIALFCAAILFFDGIQGSAFITLFACILAVIVAIFLNKSKKSVRNKRNYRTRSR